MSNLRLIAHNLLPDCLPCIALEWSSSTVVGAGSQVTAIAEYLAFCRLFALKLPSVDESLRSDALKDQSNAKGCAPLLLCRRNKQRRMQRDKL